MYNVKVVILRQTVIIIWNIVHKPVVSVYAAMSLSGCGMDSFYVKLVILRQYICIIGY